MNTRDTYKRILAAQKVLSTSASPGEKLSAVRKLVKGVNPVIDEALTICERELGTVENLLTGDILSLGVAHLPEGTEEERKRKKLIGYFVDNWNKLKGEVDRVQQELAAANDSNDKSQKQSHLGNILKHAVGPIGLVTALAIGLALLKTTAVDIVIQNEGCGTMEVSSSIPPIPGFALPAGPIVDGASATATLPPFTVSVDGTKSDMLLIKALSFTMTFELPSDIRDVTMDGASLLKTKSEIHLSDQKEHTLVLACRG